MKRTKWVVGALLLVLALGLLLAACGDTEETSTTAAPATTAGPATTSGPATTAAPGSSDTTAGALPTETLKVGAILQLTDWYSVVDAGEKGDTEFVAKMINDAGGIKAGGKAYMVELIEEDGKSSPDGNVAAANKLVLDDQVKFCLGPAAFFNVVTSPIFEQAQVLHVASYNALQPGEMDASTPLEFLGMDPVAQQSLNLKLLKQERPEVKTILLCMEDQASTPYFVPHFQALAERMGYELANNGEALLFSTQAEDFSPIAAQVNQIDADAVWFTIGTPPAYCNIIKGARTLGYDKPFVFSQYPPTTVALLGAEAATNILHTLAFAYQAPGNPKILDDIFAMGDTQRQWFGMMPNSLYMLKYAIEAADSIEPIKVKEAWEKMTEIPSIYGTSKPSGNELYGLTNHAWIYPSSTAEVTNGQIEYLGWIDPEVTP